MGASNVLLDACDFSFLLNVSIFFFAEIEVLMDYFTTFCFDLYFLSTMSLFPYLITVSVLVTNACLVSSKSPLAFSTFSLGVSDSLGNAQMVLDEMISVLGTIHPVTSRISSGFLL